MIEPTQSLSINVVYYISMFCDDKLVKKNKTTGSEMESQNIRPVVLMRIQVMQCLYSSFY
jgi:hypothetical protein